MILVSLNTWGATQGRTFFDYIKEQAATTDIFCFQEIFSAAQGAPEVSSGARMNLFSELQNLLPKFKGIFTEKSSGYDFKNKVDFEVNHGLAVFIRDNLNVLSVNSFDIGGSPDKRDPVEGKTVAQVLDLQFSQSRFSIVNYHGPAAPGTKQDTESRLSLSLALKEIWVNLPNKAKILCGDFNLYPETESIKILDGIASNLVKEFKIENTRNEVSWKRFNNRQYFADFTFTSPEVEVKNFTVPYNEVSDHLPMILEFEL